MVRYHMHKKKIQDVCDQDWKPTYQPPLVRVPKAKPHRVRPSAPRLPREATPEERALLEYQSTGVYTSCSLDEDTKDRDYSNHFGHRWASGEWMKRPK